VSRLHRRPVERIELGNPTGATVPDGGRRTRPRFFAVLADSVVGTTGC